MNSIFARTQAVLGSDAIEKLQNSSVIVFGIGGVGGNCTETLVRSGVGRLTIVDQDTIDATNINRQIIALQSNVGKVKVDEFRKRLLDINPELKLTTLQKRMDCVNLEDFGLKDFDYVIDSIDTITSKICLAEYCYENNINIISSMGFGNKVNPLDIKVSDIYKTYYCPLARVMRRELRQRRVKKLKAVWSSEKPTKTITGDQYGKRSPGSVAFVPSVAGIVIASEVIKDIIGKENNEKTRTSS